MKNGWEGITESTYIVMAKKDSSPSSLLHYTSLDVVQILLSDAIKENRETLKFHASHLKMMNDLKEGSLILDKFFTDSGTKTALKEKWEKYIESHTPFVISLIKSTKTTKGKGGIPMWKMYGANGFGAYLRFDYDKLSEYCSENLFNLKKCDYSSNGYIKGKIKELNNYREEKNANNHDDYFDELLNISSFTKSIEWEYENEWRILIPKDQNTALTKSTSRGIVEYTEVELPLTALKEICLGPLTDANSLMSVRYLCDKLQDITDTKIKLEKSKIAIRL